MTTVGLFTVEYSSISSIVDVFVADNITIVKYANDTFVTYTRPNSTGGAAIRTKSGRLT